MEQISTLTQILTDSGCEFTIHDLGRRIEQIDNQDFARIELGQQATLIQSSVRLSLPSHIGMNRNSLGSGS
ncbi:hypothetical protein JCM19232_6263 [Vibrio ishigakensis]|uniref:Uncharacterized protein n=1 Tax=Vibrio ishigakensis TaxID=1481914 RepID=A0A0B8PFU4_9VIBR|nr:hypothetical protein JCM19232_6263 [Vibrio ishigakensis]